MFVFLFGFSMLFNFVFKKKNLFQRHWWVFYGRFLSERLSYAVWSLVHCIHGTLLSCVCFNVFNTSKKETSGFLLRDFIVHAYESEITLTSSGWFARHAWVLGVRTRLISKSWYLPVQNLFADSLHLEPTDDIAWIHTN